MLLICSEVVFLYVVAEENGKKSGVVIGQWRKPQIKPNRMMDQVTEDIPSLELLHARKQQKQVDSFFQYILMSSFYKKFRKILVTASIR